MLYPGSVKRGSTWHLAHCARPSKISLPRSTALMCATLFALFAKESPVDRNEGPLVSMSPGPDHFVCRSSLLSPQRDIAEDRSILDRKKCLYHASRGLPQGHSNMLWNR